MAVSWWGGAFVSSRHCGAVEPAGPPAAARPSVPPARGVVPSSEVTLMRLFGIIIGAAMRYISAAHPERTATLPR